jgi:sialic acid synthase SpsE
MPQPSTYIIAEMACSHDGNPEFAHTIIDGAGQAGAQAIQFQIWSLPDMLVPHHSAYTTLQKLDLTYPVWAELAAYVREHYPAMHIIACVYESKSVEFCEHIQVDAYKIHSSDLSNPSLVQDVARTGKRIDLSVGASSLDEIQTAITWIRQVSQTAIWLMYGYQNFPTHTDDIHLHIMAKLKHLFELPVGYQDHSDADTEAAFWLPAAAVGMGITIQEKHITHDRSYKGADHEAALNPDEFARFVQMVRTLDGAMGISTPKSFTAEEQKYRIYSKKSVVAAHALSAGATVTDADLRFMRANEPGLPPDQAHRLVGRVTRHAIDAYHLVRESDVQ